MTANTDTVRIERTMDAADVELPERLGTVLADLYGVDRVETAAELLDAMPAAIEATGDPLGPADLCTTDEAPHSLEAGGERQAYRCVYDPMIVPFLTGQSGTISSECPTTDESIRFAVTDGGTVDATPETAVFSFGVDPSATADPPYAPDELYGFVCPYGNVFADRDAYASWAADSEAVTAALPLEYGVALAGELGRRMAKGGE